MNLSLPELPFWEARSFWAQLLLVISTALNAKGTDVMGLFAAMGLGETPAEVVDSSVSVWQMLAPLVFGFWAWWERRAPNFRLVSPWKKRATGAP